MAKECSHPECKEQCEYAKLENIGMVHHPRHYNVGGIEVIDAIEAWELGFNLGNAVKYIARAQHKGKELEDLEKAMWYLERRIDQLRRAEERAAA